MGEKQECVFSVIFDEAYYQIPIAEKGLADLTVPYEIIEKKDWGSCRDSDFRACWTFRCHSKSDAKALRKAIPTQRGHRYGNFLAEPILLPKSQPKKKPSGPKKVIKNKIYYLAKELGPEVTKWDVSRILDVNENILRLWSYNPANVSKELSELIFTRIAYLDLIDLRLEKADHIRIANRYDPDLDKYWPPTNSDFKWRITAKGPFKELVTQDYWYVSRALLAQVEIDGYKKDGVPRLRSGKCWSCYEPRFSNIANDKSLEMPVGVTNWNKYHELQNAVTVSDQDI